MAYVNVAEWSPDQVTEWLKGLDNVILPYINSFLNNEVKGQQLLNLRSDDLENLGVYTLGHQELILEAVEHLRNFHYELDRENLQFLALRLSCTAHSLQNELRESSDSNKVETQTMSDVAHIISTIKPLVAWLDRSPFSGKCEYMEIRKNLLSLSLKMATSAQRDRFAERPVTAIRNICTELANLADCMIQESSDPMLLQPASLDLATLKKRDNGLDVYILPTFHPVHQFVGAPLHSGGKIEAGDEIVQINYQTVVGWQRKKVLLLFEESPPDVLLTLKKRPRHTKIYGQIYMKPYRLPSKKRALPYTRWHDNLPSPRLELLKIPDFDIPLPRASADCTSPQMPPTCSSDSDSCGSVSDSDGSPQPGLCPRVYPLKPRPVLQRRNTVTGASPTTKGPNVSIEQFWRELKTQASYKHSSSTFIQPDSESANDTLYVRDKSASCGHGLELAPRPSTVIGISQGSSSRHQMKSNGFSNHDNSIKIKIENSSNFNKVKKVGFHFENDDRSTDGTKKSTASQKFNEQVSSDNALHAKDEESLKFIDENEDEVYDRSNYSDEWKNEIIEEIIGTLKPKQTESTNENNVIDLNINEDQPKCENTELKLKPIPKARTIIFKNGNQTNEKNAEEMIKNVTKISVNKIETCIKKPPKKPPEIPPKPDLSKKPAVPPRLFDRKPNFRGRLDKSHSAPAYDTTENEEIRISERIEPNFVNIKEIDIGNIDTIENVEEESSFENKSVSIKENIPYEMNINKIEDHINKRKLKQHEFQKHSLPKVPEIHLNSKELGSKNSLPLNISKKEIKTNTNNKNEPPIPPPRPLHTLNLDIIKNKNLIQPPKSKDTLKPVSNVPDVYNQENELVLVKPQEPNKLNIQHATKTKLNEPEIKPKVVADKYDTGVMSSHVVKAIISKGKPVKKKNSLINKRRKVSVKDISPGEIQGFLYQRIRCKNNQTVRWAKRWFILSGNILYGFKTKESLKADYLVFLSGFTVSVASEVKSKAHAFKVYHTGTVFYFAADNMETMSTWVDFITLATLISEQSKQSHDANIYSETDDSDVEQKQIKTPEKSSESSKKFSSLKKFASRKNSDPFVEGSTGSSTSLDRKYLKFFNSHSSSKSKNQNMPTPTAQFRLYKKVVPSSTPDQNTNTNVDSLHSSNNTDIDSMSNQSSTTTIQASPEHQDHETSSKKEKEELLSPSLFSAYKPKPINYIHASNPSLCDFNDFRIPGFLPTNKTTHGNDNFTGFITLEQFMLQRQAEERKQQSAYAKNESEANNEPPKKSHSRKSSQSHLEVRAPSRKNSIENNEHRKLSESNSCSSSKTLSCRRNSDNRTEFIESESTININIDDYEMQNQAMSRTPERLYDVQSRLLSSAYETRKLSSDSSMYDAKFDTKSEKKHTFFDSIKDKSYEMIFCTNVSQDNQKKHHPPTPKHKNKIVRQHSLNSSDRQSIFNRGDSPEKFWLDSLRRTDKVYTNNTAPKEKSKLKSAVQYTPMCLPLNIDQKLNPKYAFELNLDEKNSKSSGSKIKSFFNGGSKSDSEKNKEKTLLGSPRLHRTIFRKIDSPQASSSCAHIGHTTPTSGLSSSPPTCPLPALPVRPSTPPPPPDYPGLEYPPVFEPETYSLTNPACSLSLLRKTPKNQSNTNK